MSKPDITKIFAIANRRMQMHYTRELAALNIKSGLMGYLMCIRNNPGLSQEQISSLMVVEKSSVAKAVKQLEAEGYITRTTNPNSRREYVLVPTRKTEEMHDRLRAVKEKVHAMMTRNMTDIEQDLFLRLLDKIALD